MSWLLQQAPVIPVLERVQQEDQVFKTNLHIHSETLGSRGMDGGEGSEEGKKIRGKGGRKRESLNKIQNSTNIS